MRIAFLLNGMTGYLDAQYRALRALGHDLFVAYPADVTVFEAMADTDFRLDVEGYAETWAWTMVPEPEELVRRVRQFRPDAVAMTSWNFAPSYRAVMKAVPGDVVRLIIMDNLWRAAAKQWLGRLTHRVYVDPVADMAMVPSDRTEFYARRLGFGPDDVVRGSLSADVTLFGRTARDGGDLAERRAFLYVGRLVGHKGADVLARAYARYRARSLATGREPWDLHVAGTGPLASDLQDLPGVTMHGFVQPPAVARLMDRISCVVVPSRIEPYGVVVHEATCAALPVLVTDFAGAAPGLVQDGYNGWQVPSGDVEAWADALARVAALPEARLGEMSQISAALSRRLSPEGWARNLVEQLERRRTR
ncbi:glycosyltransferase family 4 protein [Jatrophihabitans fulvus]